MASLASCDNLSWHNENGMGYLKYVPENVNENTEVFVFVHGGKDMTNDNRYNDWNSVIQQQLQEHGSDSIVIMPTMYASSSEKNNEARWNENWASNTIDIVESIQQEYRLENKNVTSCGFSYGGWGAARTTIENIKRNPDLEPQVLFMLDDYGRSTQMGTLNGTPVGGGHLLTDGGQEALVQNDAIVFSYVKSSVDQSAERTRQLDTLAGAGVNLVRVVCDDGGHSAIKNNFFKNGLIDYTNGNAILPREGYTYQKANVTTDSNTGEKIVSWENVNVEDIDTKEELYNYFGVDSNRSSTNLGITPLTNSSSVSERDVFVDLAAVQQWKTQLDTINEESISQLATILTTIASLEDYWVGNFSKGFIQDSSSFVTNVQKIHNEMKSIFDPILTDVINVESNL